MGARDAASPVRALDGARARATWTALDEAIRGDAGAWTFDDDDDDARATTSGREERDAGDAIRALGYAIVPRCANRALARRVATLARGLAARGLDPTYVFVYEDAWTLLRTIETACKSRGCFGGLIMNYDVLAWCVDPVSDGEATTAFCPHRDRQPDDSPGSFSENGDAKYATAWVALANDATPENSCLYCVPRPHDPGYYDGDDDDANAKDPLSVALDSKKAFQYVRALPCKAGDGVVFTHRLIHWGSIGEGREDRPRINISFGFACESFEPAYLTSRSRVPSFDERLALVAGQLICYHERFPPNAKELGVLKKLFDGMKSSFDDAYVRKVNKEFANAALRGENDDEVEEDALDAMLDAADDFDDDFDDFEDGVEGDAYGRVADGDDALAKRSKRK